MIKNSKIKKLKENKYRVYSEKGRNMGTYNSKEKAKERLKQIEFFKHQAKADDMENSVDDIGVIFEADAKDKLGVEDLFPEQSTGDMPTLHRPNPDGVWHQRQASLNKRSTGLTSMVSYIDRPPDLEEPFTYLEEDDFLFRGSDEEEMPGNKSDLNNEIKDNEMNKKSYMNYFYDMVKKEASANVSIKGYGRGETYGEAIYLMHAIISGVPENEVFNDDGLIHCFYILNKEDYTSDIFPSSAEILNDYKDGQIKRNATRDDLDQMQHHSSNLSKKSPKLKYNHYTTTGLELYAKDWKNEYGIDIYEPTLTGFKTKIQEESVSNKRVSSLNPYEKASLVSNKIINNQFESSIKLSESLIEEPLKGIELIHKDIRPKEDKDIQELEKEILDTSYLNLGLANIGIIYRDKNLDRIYALKTALEEIKNRKINVGSEDKNYKDLSNKLLKALRLYEQDSSLLKLTESLLSSFNSDDSQDSGSSQRGRGSSTPKKIEEKTISDYFNSNDYITTGAGYENNRELRSSIEEMQKRLLDLSKTSLGKDGSKYQERITSALGDADGKYGSQTSTAIMLFQGAINRKNKSRILRENGVLDKKTYEYLFPAKGKVDLGSTQKREKRNLVDLSSPRRSKVEKKKETAQYGGFNNQDADFLNFGLQSGQGQTMNQGGGSSMLNAPLRQAPSEQSGRDPMLYAALPPRRSSRKNLIENLYKVAENSEEENTELTGDQEIKQKELSNKATILIRNVIYKDLSEERISFEDIFADERHDTFKAGFLDGVINKKLAEIRKIEGFGEVFKAQRDGGKQTPDAFIKSEGFINKQFLIEFFGKLNIQDPEGNKQFESATSQGVISKGYGLNPNTKTWDENYVNYFMPIQKALFNLASTKVAENLKDGVDLDDLQKKVIRAIGLADASAADGKYGSKTAKAVKEIYRNTNYQGGKADGTMMTNELVQDLLNYDPSAKRTITGLGREDRGITATYIKRSQGGFAFDIYFQDEYGGMAKVTSGVPTLAEGKEKEYKDEIVKILSNIVNQPDIDAVFTAYNALNPSDFEPNSEGLEAVKSEVSAVETFSVVNFLKEEDTPVYSLTGMTQEGITSLFQETEAVDLGGEDASSQEEASTEKEEENKTLPEGIESDSSKGDNEGESYQKPIEAENLGELVSIMNQLREGRLSLSATASKKEDMIKEARKSIRKGFFEKLTEEKVFDEKYVKSYNEFDQLVSISKYAQDTQGERPRSSLRETKTKFDTDEIASKFSEVCNEIHNFLKSNGMRAEMEGVATAIYRYYLKNQSRYGGTGGINLNNAAQYYMAGLDLLEDLTGKNMSGTASSDFRRDTAKKVRDKYSQYGERIASSFPNMKTLYQEDMRSLGITGSYMVSYLMNIYSNDKKGDKFGGYFADKRFSDKRFYYGLGLQNKYDKLLTEIKKAKGDKKSKLYRNFANEVNNKMKNFISQTYRGQR
jgi:peptidoglycan hydrolase-like protein with peptidoglycan-binding domain